MMRQLGLIVLSASLMLGGCGTVRDFFGGKDNTIPPTPLENIEETVQLSTVWSTKTGVGTDGAMVRLKPYLSSRVIYVVDREGQVSALDRENGGLKWQVELDDIITGGIGAGNGMVYVGNDAGEIIAMNETDGQVQWQKLLSSVSLSVPLVYGNIVVVRTVDGKLYGLEADSGAQLWVYDRGVPVLTLRGVSDPILGGTQLVFTGFDSGKVAAVGINQGRLLWEANAAVPSGRSDIERLVDIDGDMILIGSVLYVVTYQGRLVAMDALKGEIFWARNMSSYAGIGADERHIYVSDDQSNVWAVDRRSGDTVWKQDKLTYRNLSAPVAMGDSVLVGDLEGYVHILSRIDGTLTGRKKLNGKAISTKPIAEQGVLYIYADDGQLSANRLN